MVDGCHLMCALDFALFGVAETTVVCWIVCSVVSLVVAS